MLPELSEANMKRRQLVTCTRGRNVLLGDMNLLTTLVIQPQTPISSYGYPSADTLFLPAILAGLARGKRGSLASVLLLSLQRWQRRRMANIRTWSKRGR